MADFFKDTTPIAANKVGFAIYHFGQGGVDAFGKKDDNTFAHHGYDREQCNYQESLGYMNYYSYRLYPEQYSHLRRTRNMGATNWMYYFPFVQIELPNGKKPKMLKPGWKEEITKIVEDAKKAGYWNSIAGFSYDEPLLHTDGETFEEFSKFMAGFGKRQFAVFSMYETTAAPFEPLDIVVDPAKRIITPSNTQYLTDIAYDLYSYDPKYDDYKRYNDIMLNAIQRDNVYVWGFPTTFANFSATVPTEAACIKNLEMHRDLLLNDVRYPGGLYCYTWRTWPCEKRHALDYLLDTNNPERWNDFEKVMVDIGKELSAIDLKEIK